MDLELFHYINDQLSNAFLDRWMPVISYKMTWVPVYVLFVVVALIKFKKEAWKPVLAILLTFVLTELVTNTLKHTFKRKRPNHIEELHAIKRVEGGSGYSTPSGHSSNHMAIAVIVGLVLGVHWSWKVLLYVWAVVIGLSRVYNGVHFPSDVLLGFGLGGIIALLVYMLYRRFLPLAKVQ